MTGQYQKPAYTPKLTVHIEADSFGELMRALDTLMDDLSASGMGSGIPDMTGDASASLSVGPLTPTGEGPAPAPRPRGRPRKDAAAPTPEQAVAAVMEETPAPAPAPVSGAMQTLTPHGAREKGIELIQTHFATNPACLDQITKVCQKYKVTAFADVKDEDALTFLADITLIVSGNGEVA